MSLQPAIDPSGVTELADRPRLLRGVHVPGAEEGRVRRAVILAAGLGSRLAPLTIGAPKCLTEINGRPILLRALKALARQGLSEAVIIVGHHADKVRERVGTSLYGLNITYVDAPRYVTTNNIHSLWDARDFCDEDILLLEGDVVFDEHVLTQLLEQPRSAAAVVPYQRVFCFCESSRISGRVIPLSNLQKGFRFRAFLARSMVPRSLFGGCRRGFEAIWSAQMAK